MEKWEKQKLERLQQQQQQQRQQQQRTEKERKEMEKLGQEQMKLDRERKKKEADLKRERMKQYEEDMPRRAEEEKKRTQGQSMSETIHKGRDKKEKEKELEKKKDEKEMKEADWLASALAILLSFVFRKTASPPKEGERFKSEKLKDAWKNLKAEDMRGETKTKDQTKNGAPFNSSPSPFPSFSSTTSKIAANGAKTSPAACKLTYSNMGAEEIWNKWGGGHAA